MKPLTTVVGINCKDGIVLYADSQETHYENDQPRFKRLIQNKLSDIGTHRYYMIGCAGSSTDLELLVEHLNENEKLCSSSLHDELEFHALLEKEIIPEFLEKHNVTLPTRTHGEPTKYPIEVDALFAAQLQGDQKHMLYKIETSPRQMIRRVPKYGSIGSGSELVNPLLDQLNQHFEEFRYGWHGISTRLAAKITYLILGISLKADFATGGTARCRILTDEEGVTPLDRTKIWEDPKASKIVETLSLACKELPKVEERIRKIVSNLFEEHAEK